MNIFNAILMRVRDAYASRFEPEGVRPLADIYWRTLLVLAVTLVLCAVLYGIWDLFGVLDALASVPDTSPPPPAALNRTTLETVVQGFQTRQTRFNDFGSTHSAAIPDPSR
ncbi:MAG: hypothetical protein KGH79_02505 [Patescibacteria group bacterium]|nr:hypothetical protein [Patescibacteria group bacterium]